MCVCLKIKKKMHYSNEVYCQKHNNKHIIKERVVHDQSFSKVGHQWQRRLSISSLSWRRGEKGREARLTKFSECPQLLVYEYLFVHGNMWILLMDLFLILTTSYWAIQLELIFLHSKYYSSTMLSPGDRKKHQTYCYCCFCYFFPRSGSFGPVSHIPEQCVTMN